MYGKKNGHLKTLKMKYRRKKRLRNKEKRVTKRNDVKRI